MSWETAPQRIGVMDEETRREVDCLLERLDAALAWLGRFSEPELMRLDQANNSWMISPPLLVSRFSRPP